MKFLQLLVVVFLAFTAVTHAEEDGIIPTTWSELTSLVDGLTEKVISGFQTLTDINNQILQLEADATAQIKEALDVTGSAVFSGAGVLSLTADAVLDIAADATVVLEVSKVEIEAGATIKGAGRLLLNGTALNLKGDVTFDTDLFISATSNLVGDVEAAIKVAKSLTIAASASLNVTAKATLDVAANAALELEAGAKVVGEGVLNLAASAAVKAKGAAQVTTQVVVKGAAKLEANLEAALELAKKLSVEASGSLDVSGTVNVNGGLNVAASGSVNVNGVLDLSGSTDVKVDGTLQVNADGQLNAKVSADLKAALKSLKLDANAKVHVDVSGSGDLDVSAALNVDGETELKGSLSVSIDAAVDSAVLLKGNFKGELTVSGDVTVNSRKRSGETYEITQNENEIKIEKTGEDSLATIPTLSVFIVALIALLN